MYMYYSYMQITTVNGKGSHELKRMQGWCMEEFGGREQKEAMV